MWLILSVYIAILQCTHAQNSGDGEIYDDEMFSGESFYIIQIQTKMPYWRTLYIQNWVRTKITDSNSGLKLNVKRAPDSLSEIVHLCSLWKHYYINTEFQAKTVFHLLTVTFRSLFRISAISITPQVAFANLVRVWKVIKIVTMKVSLPMKEELNARGFVYQAIQVFCQV